MKTKAFIIAKWEFVEKVKSKAFIISLILMPVVILGIAFLPTLFSMKEDDEPVAIGIIDRTKSLIDPLDLRLQKLYILKDGQPNYILRNLDGQKPVDKLKGEANDLVAKGTIEG